MARIANLLIFLICIIYVYKNSGCGFGGLLFALSEHYPEQLVMGMEIRSKVVNFVGEKVRALRS